MPYQLEQNYTVLDGNNFSTPYETNTNQFFFSDRVRTCGILNFGYIAKGDEVKINLAENGITSPIAVDSIIAFAPTSTNDEIFFYLYTTIDGNEVKIGTQRFSNNDMPKAFPNGVVFPDMTIGVKPTKTDSTVIMYAKPVEILFEATPSS